MKDRYTCNCGELLGSEQGAFIIYPNPLICPKCGRDNSDDFLTWLLIKAEDENPYY
jgi:hypothetical protein